MHAEENLIEVIAHAAATKLTPQEAHAIGVSLAIRFGKGCKKARTYATHVNATREKLGLPKITQVVAGNPSAEERLGPVSGGNRETRRQYNRSPSLSHPHYDLAAACNLSFRLSGNFVPSHVLAALENPLQRRAAEDVVYLLPHLLGLRTC